MYARTPYAAGPWSSGTIPVAPIPGSVVIPPPIPDATTTYATTVQPGVGPWAWRSWAGATPMVAGPSGGISVAPDPAAGVMRIWAWWPDAPSIQVIRISETGVRTPVRGGYPVAVVGTTRRNRATNPSLETGLNGYVAGAGTPTLSRIARTDDPTAGSWALRAQVAGAGSNEVTIPQSLTVGRVTLGFDLRLSALPTSVTITLGWNDSTGGALTAATATLTASQYTASVNQYTRHVVVLNPPNGAAQVGSLKINVGGMPAGGQMDLDRITAETASTDGSYVDGTTLGGTWSGTEHLSMSVVASVQTLADGECPLDVPVTYEVYYPAVVGRAGTLPVTLSSTPSGSAERVWLTHPLTPSVPLECRITTAPDLEHVLEQGVFPILDSPTPVVVSASTRLAPAGAVEFLTETWAERDRLIHDVFADGTPVLLRAPARYGYDEEMWIVLGTIREPAGGKGWEQTRLLTAGFQVVEAPARVT
jgi:hypothetical protein